MSSPALPTPPPAARARTPGWRDPRLWIGVAIVAASVVVGARVLAAADDSVEVWALARDLGPGDRVDADDLVATRVRFGDDADLAAYVGVDDEIPADASLLRGVGAGELLPRAALGDAADSGSVEVPVAVPPELAPPGVASGAVVDVYLLAPGERGDGEPVLTEVSVADAPVDDAGFAASGQVQLVLLVPEADARAWFDRLAALDDPVVHVAVHR